MGKFNKTVNTDDLDESVNSGVDWQQLIANFQTLSVEDALKNIMAKVIHIHYYDFFSGVKLICFIFFKS